MQNSLTARSFFSKLRVRKTQQPVFFGFSQNSGCPWLSGPFKPFFGLSGASGVSWPFMPWGLKRFHASGQTHFVTFCCHRRPSFTTPIPWQVLRGRAEACAPQFRTLPLRLCGHARTRSPAAPRTAAANSRGRDKVIEARSIAAIDRRGGAFLAKALL